MIADGRVLTNAHVLRGEEVAVRRADGEVALGRVAALDDALDVAVVAVDTGGAPAIEWDPAAVEGLRAGRAVFALAEPRRPRPAHHVRPRHRDRPLVPRPAAAAASAARSSTRRRSRAARRAARSSTPTAGCSGSTPCAWRAGCCSRCPPTPRCARVVDKLGRGETPSRPRLGLALAPPRAARRLRAAVGLPERDGLLVRGVEDGSPAAAAGLRQGDLLVAAAGRPLESVDELLDALESAPGSIALTVVRGTEEREVGRTLQFVKHCARMGRRMPNSDCPVCRTADIVCGKWTLLVIRDLAESHARFCELERSLEGISPRTLSLRLRALEEEGIVARKTFPEVPPRVEYALTEKGRALVPIIESMRAYGTEWLGAAGSCAEAPEPVVVAA